VRALFPLARVGLSATAYADRLITVPTATKIRLNTIKAEGLWEQSRARTQKYYLGTGITDAIDVELTGERFENHRFRTSLDVAYNYLPPLPGFGPGVSFGVQDAFGVTRDGRRFYLAITTREGDADTVSGWVSLEYTIGMYFGAISSPFIGVSIPFTPHVKFLAEHNGRRISAGVEIRPTSDIGLRAVFERKDVLIGAQVTLRF
jgi:hypothetical protein